MTKLISLKTGLALMLFAAALSAIAFQEPFLSSGKSIAATGKIELAFTPEDAADLMVIRAIRGAHKQILVQAFSFTHRDIAHALIQAKKRGVDVQLIADAEQTDKIQPNMIADIAASGIRTYLDFQHQSAHNKIMVIDASSPDSAVVTGSFNFTYAAQFKNAENLVIFRGNPEITAAYLENWKRHLAHASRYRR
ncbi:MAG TPA: phospholipase D family protein [Burkholderiales bacterium]|nr:phospholipase D family protein [Burkholderiales bacterium]